MKLKLAVVAMIPALLASAPTFAREKFERALVLTGGGFNSPLYMGILEGLIKNGWTPDVVIGTCGNSMTAAIANSFPKAEDRKNYMERQSGGLFDLLTIPGVNPDVTGFMGKISLAKQAASMNSAASTDLSTIANDTYPNLFSGTILTLKDAFNDKTLGQKFHAEDGAIRAVVVASKLSFAQCNAGQKCSSAQTYQEVFFTDPDTATLLNGFQAPVATDPNFPKNFIQKATATITDSTLGEAVRASISDPYMIAPMTKGQATYGPGVVDLYPVEAAQQIAKEVILVHDGQFAAVPEGTIRTTFGYSINQRRDKAVAAVQKRVDLTDVTDDDKGFASLNLSPEFSVKTVSVTPRVSKDNFKDFEAREKAQMDLGQKTAKEQIPAAASPAAKPAEGKKDGAMNDMPSDQRILERRIRAVEAWKAPTGDLASESAAKEVIEGVKNRFKFVRNILAEAPATSPYTEMMKRYNDSLKRVGEENIRYSYRSSSLLNIDALSNTKEEPVLSSDEIAELEIKALK